MENNSRNALLEKIESINSYYRESTRWESLSKEDKNKATYLLRLYNLAVKENKSEEYIYEKLAANNIDIDTIIPQTETPEPDPTEADWEDLDDQGPGNILTTIIAVGAVLLLVALGYIYVW